LLSCWHHCCGQNDWKRLLQQHQQKPAGADNGAVMLLPNHSSTAMARDVTPFYTLLLDVLLGCHSRVLGEWHRRLAAEQHGSSRLWHHASVITTSAWHLLVRDAQSFRLRSCQKTASERGDLPALGTLCCVHSMLLLLHARPSQGILPPAKLVLLTCSTSHFTWPPPSRPYPSAWRSCRTSPSGRTAWPCGPCRS
jgi:hypothetical protein